MPTIMKIGSYRFFFYSNEGSEPAHIHVQEGRNMAKFWINPVGLASSTRFSSAELNKLLKLVIENQTNYLEAWNAYFIQ